MGDPKDRVLRAITNDGGFRVITANTTETVRRAAAAQGARGETARAFGELLTGAILYRETMAPKLRVQVVLQGAGGRGQLVADSMPDGSARGLVRLPKDTKRIELRNGALLEMMRTMPRGDLHRGVVEVPRNGNISDALMGYLQTSEQVVSMVSVGVKMVGDEIAAAGGYIVQLLPELEEPMLMLMTARLEDFRSIETLFESVADTPEHLMSELLYGIEHTTLDETPLRFACTCSELRVISSLATLSKHDIEDLMRDGTDLEMSCDYCGAEYRIAPEKLRGMLEPA
jgi:molecular chaperone Hsp33